jgi:hypothetical protein
MAITKTIEIDVVAPNAQQNINAVTSSLNNASKSSDNLNKNLNSDKGSSKFTGLKDAIGGIVPGFDKASNASSAFNKQLLILLANPIGFTIAAIVLAVAGLVAIFKTFQPVVDKVEQGLAALSAVATTIKNTFIAVATGTKSLGEAFSSLGSDISDTASRTMDLVKAQQDLDDVLAQQEVQTSRTRAEINKLNVQAKNRALSEAERLKLLEKAGKLEEQDFQQRRKNADEEVRIAREAIAIKAGFSKAEIKLLKEQGLAAKELAESKGGNFDEEFKALANAQKNRIGLEDESTANLEKNQNKRDALEDAQQAKQEAAETKRIERIEKANQKKLKLQEEAKKATDEEYKRTQDALAENNRQELASLDIIDAAKKANSDALLTEQQKQINDENIAYKIKYDNAVKFGQDTEDLEIEHLNKINDINLTAQNKKYEDDKIARDKSIADAKIEADTKLAIQQGALDALGGLVGLAKSIGEKNKGIQKAALVAETALGIANVILNTNVGSSKEVATKGIFGLATSTILYAKMGISIASILAASAKGLQALGGGGSGASASGATGAGGGGGTSAPQFNIVGQSSTNQLAQTISTQQKQPIKTYVVAGDVTTQQSLDRNAVQTSTFGG